MSRGSNNNSGQTSMKELLLRWLSADQPAPAGLFRLVAGFVGVPEPGLLGGQGRRGHGEPQARIDGVGPAIPLNGQRIQGLEELACDLLGMGAASDLEVVGFFFV